MTEVHNIAEIRRRIVQARGAAPRFGATRPTQATVTIPARLRGSAVEEEAGMGRVPTKPAVEPPRGPCVKRDARRRSGIRPKRVGRPGTTDGESRGHNSEATRMRPRNLCRA